MARTPRPEGSKLHHTEPAFDPVSTALRQLHDAVAGEALPDDFLRLLDEIDQRIAAAKPAQPR